MKKILRKELAISLRKKGYSYSYIKNQTKISKSTLSYWLSATPYTPNEYSLLQIKKARQKSALIKSKQKNISINKAKKIAKKDIGDIVKRDLFMLGLGLYLGDGAKTQNIIRVINSNPKIIKLAIRWFKKVCGLGIPNFTLAIHLYPDSNLKSSMEYWSKVTQIPINQFGKTQIDTRLKKKASSRNGSLSYGTAHLTIRSNGNKKFGVFLSRRINAWMELVLE